MLKLETTFAFACPYGLNLMPQTELAVYDYSVDHPTLRRGVVGTKHQ
jgi:hypothetical protein